MRSLLRAGIAVALLVIIFVFKTHLETAQAQWEPLRDFFFPDGKTEEAKSPANAGKPGSVQSVNSQNDSTTPELTTTSYKSLPSPSIVPTATESNTDGETTPSDRIIVVGTLVEEDTDWVVNELPE
jgi:hypothetical protein